MSFLFINKILGLSNLKTRTAMNAKISVFVTCVEVIVYSGISIKRTHCEADTSVRRTVWRGTDCFALRSNYLRKNLYQADISIKRTHFFCTNSVCIIEIPLYLLLNNLHDCTFKRSSSIIQKIAEVFKIGFQSCDVNMKNKNVSYMCFI